MQKVAAVTDYSVLNMFRSSLQLLLETFHKYCQGQLQTLQSLTVLEQESSTQKRTEYNKTIK